VAHVAKELGVSRQCAHRWVARFDAQGWDGLADRSSRPRSSPRRTSPEREAAVIAARRDLRSGPALIAEATGVPERTVSRILRRAGMPHLSICDPLTGEVIRATKTTAVRYEHDRPGSLVHIDVKKLGRIPDGGGWKAHGRAERPGHKRGLGYDYIHSAVDDHSRLAYSEILDDEKGTTCAGFLTRAAEFFAAHGIDIDRVLTDNAKNYLLSAAFKDAAAALGVTQVFIRPHCPWQNGKVERFNRTLQTEWAYRQVFETNDARSAALGPWLEHYNHRRTHSAIGGPPISRVSPT
jgi:transposase InsO family protein